MTRQIVATYPSAATRADASPYVVPGSGFGLLQTLANSMAPGDYLDITSSSNIQSRVDTSGPGGALNAYTDSDSSIANSMFDWGGKAPFDPVNRCFWFLGNGAGYSGAGGTHSKLLKLDALTLQFSVVTWNPVGTTTGHFYDASPSRIHNGYFYRFAFQGSDTYRLEVATNTWTNLGKDSLMGLDSEAPSMDVHPGLGSQGSLIFCSYGGLLVRHNLADNVRTVIAASHSGVATSDTVCSHHPGISAAVFGGGATADGGSSLYKIDNAGTVSLLSSSYPAGVLGIGPCNGGPVTIYLPDPQGRAFAWLLDPSTTRKVWRHNLTDGTWTDAGAIPTAMKPAGDATWVVASHVPELGVILIVDADTPVASPPSSTSRLWLYKPA